MAADSGCSIYDLRWRVRREGDSVFLDMMYKDQMTAPNPEFFQVLEITPGGRLRRCVDLPPDYGLSVDDIGQIRIQPNEEE